MGLLDDLLANLQQNPGALGMPSPGASAGFASPYDESDPAAVAQAAREAAAGTLSRGVRRPTAFTGAKNEATPFGGMMSSMGLLNAPGGNSVADLPPSTNDPQASEPEVFRDGVPLPRPRPDSGLNGQPQAAGAPLSLAPGDGSDSAALPPNAAPAGPASPSEGGGASPLGDGLKNVLGKIFDPNKAATWMALGSGFAGAPNIGQGISRASAAAVPAMAADRANEIKQTGIGATYKALVARGVPPAEALAAVYNPEVMKATAAKYFETKPYVPHKIGVDMMGNDIMGSFNPNNNKFYDAAGKELGAGGSGANIPDSGAGMLAKGVTEYNQELPAEEYKAQFSPAVQAQMDAYIRGDTQPTGNPRLKGSATKVKEWATLYGSKAGIPVSDAAFSERRKYRTELGSASANTAGGQSKAFNQGIEHADALAKKLEQLGNVDPIGIPSVGHGLNWMRQAFSSKQTGIAKEAASIGQTLAGEVGKLFSGSQGGGVHERELTRQRFNTITTPAELAGALDATVETMEGGLRALEGRRDQILGPGSNVTFVTKETQQKIDNIRGTIKRLRGDEDAPPAQAAPALAPGQSRRIGEVTIQRIN